MIGKGGRETSEPLLSISFVVYKRLPLQAGRCGEVCVGLADIPFSVQTRLWKEEGGEEGDVWMRSSRVRKRREGTVKSIKRWRVKRLDGRDLGLTEHTADKHWNPSSKCPLPSHFYFILFYFTRNFASETKVIEVLHCCHLLVPGVP